jgi:hypothetical protein
MLFMIAARNDVSFKSFEKVPTSQYRYVLTLFFQSVSRIDRSREIERFI